MKYTILNLSRRNENKEGVPLMTKEKAGPNGEMIPGRPYMLVSILVHHEGQDIWATTFDFEGHTAEWDIGSEIEGIITQKGEYNGRPQYVFNRPRDQKPELQKFLKRIGKIEKTDKEMVDELSF